MAALTLAPADAKLIYLAIAYHLGRPGSELDAETKQEVEHGLAETARQLQPQLSSAAIALDLNDFQRTRLLSAMLGAVNELKVYPMLDPLPTEEGGGRRSTVTGFDQTLRSLFPQVEEDVEATLRIAADMMTLRRRVEAAVGPAPGGLDADSTAEEPVKKRPWWRLFGA